MLNFPSDSLLLFFFSYSEYIRNQELVLVALKYNIFSSTAVKSTVGKLSQRPPNL